MIGDTLPANVPVMTALCIATQHVLVENLPYMVVCLPAGVGEARVEGGGPSPEEVKHPGE